VGFLRSGGPITAFVLYRDVVSRFARADDVLHAEVSGEVIVLNTETLSYFGFNEVAGRVWELLGTAPHSLDELCAVLLTEYEVDEASCRQAVEEFLSHAGDQGLVVEA